jgi:hypothetical protein
MSTVNLGIRYRPVRVGWCVRQGNMDDVRTSLRLTHTLWGGRYNPLISIGIGSDARDFLRRLCVDVLYPAAEVPELINFAESFPNFKWPLHHYRYPQFFTEFGQGVISPFLDIYHPVSQLHKEYVKGESKPKLSATLFSWDLADPLADIFLAQFGSYPAAGETKLDYPGFVTRMLNGKTVSLGREDSIPADVYSAFTPSAISGFDLEPDRVSEYDGFYVGESENFEDVVNFWNLRAADLDLFFFDFREEKRLAGFRDGFVREIHSRTPGPQDLPTFVGIWSRNRLPDLHMKGFGHAISERIVRNGDSGLPVPIMQFRPKRVLGNISDTERGTQIAFQLPEKPFREDDASFHQLMVVGIRPGATSWREFGRTLITLPLPEMNDFYRKEMVFIGNEVRIQRSGLDVITSADSSDFSFYACQTANVIIEFFRVFGIHVEPSLPGLVAMRMIRQMNDLQGCRVFKLPGVRKLIEEYGPLQSFTRGAATLTIAQIDPSTKRPNLPQLFVEGAELTSSTAFDYLLRKGALRAGLDLLCPNCNLNFWLALETLGHKVVCEYCGGIFDAATQLKDRGDWRFRRSGLFGKDNHQEGAIPVVLTLQQLETNVSPLTASRLFATSFTLSSSGARISPCETDFVMLEFDTTGEIELAIGECKAGGEKSEISEADVKNLSAVADSFPPGRVTVYIVFSKTGPFSETEIARCRAAQDPHSPRVILLSDRELEPYHIYERTAKQFDIRPIASSFRDLARATNNIFFAPKPRVAAAIDASPTPAAVQNTTLETMEDQGAERDTPDANESAKEK